MFKNYFNTAWRSLLKQKIVSLINIFGLSIGVAMTLLLGRFVQKEMSYDRFYQNQGSIYRVYQETKINGRESKSITGSGLMGPTMKSIAPEIELAGRIHRVGSAVLQLNNSSFIENHLSYADNELLEIIELDFVSGNKREALSEPNGFVISESMSERLFGKGEALNQTLLVNDQNLIVTGVYKDMPKNSHLRPRNGFISNKTQPTFSWNRVGHVTYLRLQAGADPSMLTSKFERMVEQNIYPVLPAESEVTIHLIPIEEIWLSEDPYQQGGGSKSANRSYLIIAAFMILIAAINYMNLATARSMRRAKEIGMRKVIGAAKKHVMFQFLIESILISLSSVLIGGFLAEMGTQMFNELTGRTIEIGFSESPVLILILIAAGIGLGFLSGIYPAFFLSKFKPNEVFTLANTGSQKNAGFRRVLVTLQFTISVGLMISTLTVYKQMNYIHNKDLGYDAEQVYSMRLGRADTAEVMKNAILKIPGVTAIAATNNQPATGDSGATFIIKDDKGEVHKDIVSMATIDYDYLSTMKMTLAEGRNFSRDFSTDTEGIIINQKMVKRYGWENPLGQKINMGQLEDGSFLHEFTVIGVVEDFNQFDLTYEIKNFAFFLQPQFNWGPKYFMVKLESDDYEQTINAIQDVYESFEQNRPFSGIFLNDYFEQVYDEENKKAKTYLTFSVITIFIACIGLFGLASFILQSRIKEISIRKVMGAQMSDIIRLVSKEFVLVIIIAAIIASPIAYYFTKDWLDGFVYRTVIGAEVYTLSTVITLLIALSTIAIQAIKTAKTNPANTLRNQ